MAKMAMNEQARFIQWNDGYKDGFRLKPNARPNNSDYVAGYNKGKADKEFCETYSDEALGIY